MILKRLILLLVLSFAGLAHEMPRYVAAMLRVMPEARSLKLAARVPLEAMRDVEFPETAEGYLLVEKLEPQLKTIATTWVANAIQLKSDGVALPRPVVVSTRLALQSDRSFADFRQGDRTAFDSQARVVWKQLWLDVWMEIPVESAGKRVAIRPGLEGLGAEVVTAVEYAGRLFELRGDPGWVELEPGLWSSTRRFGVMGFQHILEGLDHVLFLVCVVLPMRDLWKLLGVVTAFAVGHSITLAAAVLGWGPQAQWFPPLVECLIAASILWLAIENIVGAGQRWALVAGFGLVHGFGFAFALGESMQFAGNHVAAALFAFNLGVEAGQVAVVGILWGAFRLFPLNRVWLIILSTLAGHTAWHWLLERWLTLERFWVSQ